MSEEKDTFTSADRTAIIAAAAGSVPSNLSGKAWEDAVVDRAIDITMLARTGSRVSKLVDRAGNAKMFTATVVSVVKEESSQRGLVTLKTAPSKFHKDGIETARTDRLDDFDAKKAADAKALCLNLKNNLIGHKVIVFVGSEGSDGTEYRILLKVIDLGVDKDFAGAE